MSAQTRFLLVTFIIMILSMLASGTSTAIDGFLVGFCLGLFNIMLYRWVTAPDRVNTQQENLQS